MQATLWGRCSPTQRWKLLERPCLVCLHLRTLSCWWRPCCSWCCASTPSSTSTWAPRWTWTWTPIRDYSSPFFLLFCPPMRRVLERTKRGRKATRVNSRDLFFFFFLHLGEGEKSEQKKKTTTKKESLLFEKQSPAPAGCLITFPVRPPPPPTLSRSANRKM